MPSPFHPDGDALIQRFVVGAGLVVAVVVFHPTAPKLAHLGHVAARPVHDGAQLAFGISNHQRGDVVQLGYPEVIGAKRGRDVHDAGTVLSGHEVASDDAESSLLAFKSWKAFVLAEQTLVADANQVSTGELSLNFARAICFVSLRQSEYV